MVHAFPLCRFPQPLVLAVEPGQPCAAGAAGLRSQVPGDRPHEGIDQFLDVRGVGRRSGAVFGEQPFHDRGALLMDEVPCIGAVVMNRPPGVP